MSTGPSDLHSEASTSHCPDIPSPRDSMPQKARYDKGIRRRIGRRWDSSMTRWTFALLLCCSVGVRRGG